MAEGAVMKVVQTISGGMFLELLTAFDFDRRRAAVIETRMGYVAQVLARIDPDTIADGIEDARTSSCIHLLAAWLHVIHQRFKYQLLSSKSTASAPGGNILQEIKNANVTRPAALRIRGTIDFLLDGVDWTLMPISRSSSSGRRSSSGYVGSSHASQSGGPSVERRRSARKMSISGAIHGLVSGSQPARRSSLNKGDSVHHPGSRAASRRSSMVVIAE